MSRNWKPEVGKCTNHFEPASNIKVGDYLINGDATYEEVIKITSKGNIIIMTLDIRGHNKFSAQNSAYFEFYRPNK